jgi:RNase P subunit RPR2
MDFLNSKKVKTRKPHICHGCQELIPANTENVDTQTIANEGTVYTIYNCKRCDDWINKNPNYFDDNEWNEGDIKTAMKEQEDDRKSINTR